MLGLDQASRAAYLAERCGEDAELQAAVERLVVALTGAQGVLPSGGPGAVDALVRLAEAEAEAATEGARIGPYRILRASLPYGPPPRWKTSSGQERRSTRDCRLH